MDLYSFGENSPVLIVRKRPFGLETGSVKARTVKQPLNMYMPGQPEMVDLVVTVNGSDEAVPGVPKGMEIVEYRNSYYCAGAEGAQQVVANLMQAADAHLGDVPYWEKVKREGEDVMERLNPSFAEGRRQARTIVDLQQRVDAQDKKLDDITQQNMEILAFVRKMGAEDQKKKGQ